MTFKCSGWPSSCSLPKRSLSGNFKKRSACHLIYDISKLLASEFMVSITNFKSFSIQHDVHCANYSPTESKIDIKAGYVFRACLPCD